jgi:hypothetical protein
VQSLVLVRAVGWGPVSGQWASAVSIDKIAYRDSVDSGGIDKDSSTIDGSRRDRGSENSNDEYGSTSNSSKAQQKKHQVWLG